MATQLGRSRHLDRQGGGQAAIDSDARSTDAVTFVTTEHFALQGARAATVAESTGRANMFLAAVSGGLVALGLVAAASSLGAAFYGFGLVLLPTLTFVGLCHLRAGAPDLDRGH